MHKPTPIYGISWYKPEKSSVLESRDGRAVINFKGIPVPLENADFKDLAGAEPGYDMVGRGIYTALRTNPDCSWNTVYAEWLRDAYPHLLAELASHIIMLDNKDVDVKYLDRKICYMRIMALLEPDNASLASEIGAACLDRGTRMSALHQCTVMLYRAEKYLSIAVNLSPDDLQSRLRLAEVDYLIGRYDAAARIWNDLLDEMKGDDRERTNLRLKKISEGKVPRIPPVDYFEAVGVAFECYQSGAFEESSAILSDLLDDIVFVEDFPLPEVWHHLGLCYRNLAMPEKAKDCFNEALRLYPEFIECRNSLDALTA